VALRNGTRDTPDARGLLATYLDLLSVPGARQLALTSLVSKLSISMLPISALLLLSSRYSYAEAGLSAGVLQLANAVSSPVRGRLAARYPVRVLLPLCLAGCLAGLTGLLLTASATAAFGYVLLCGTVMGLCFPPISMLLRTYWTALDRTRARPSANALESALMDVTLITGPVLAAWLSTSVGPVPAFAAVGVLMAAGVVLLLTVKDAQNLLRAGGGTGHWARPLRSRALLCVFAAQFLFCAALAATEVALPVSAQQNHAAAFSGWYLAGMSVGSIVGALALGAVPALGRAGLPGLLGAFAAGLWLLAAVMGSGPWVLLLACPVTGIAVGSTFATLYTRIGTLTPPGSDNETQGWANAMTAVGFACGASVGGVVAGANGASAALVTAGATALAAALLTRTGSVRAPAEDG
jgi:MFS family permease